MRVTIYHGYDGSGRMVFPYDNGARPDIAVEAYTYEMSDLLNNDPNEILEVVWRYNNVVDGTEAPVIFGTRSLSIGDIVGLDETLYLVEGTGWTEINELPPLVTEAERKALQPGRRAI
jgi:hypothetical protein